MLTDPLFWKAAAERALKTFAQALGSALLMSSTPINVLHANWGTDLGLALGAALASLLTSIASLTPITSQGGQHSA